MSLAKATGKIGPGAPEIVKALRSGEFHGPCPDTIPARCIDGRPTIPAGAVVPCSAGGTVGLAIAAALCALGEKDLAEDTATLAAALRHYGLPTGAHTDDHATGAASGCGAADHAATVLNKLADTMDDVTAVAKEIGLEIAPDIAAKLSARARQLRFPAGGELVQAVAAAPGAEITQCQGAHLEQAVVVNWRPGTTLHAAALQEKFGRQGQCFDVDAWALPAAAHAVAVVYPQAVENELIAALTCFNIAAALTLCAPEMEVIVLN